MAILSGMIEELWRQRRPELVVIMGRGDQPWADGAEVQRHDLHDGQEKAAAILSGMIEEFSRQRRPELVVIMGRGDPPWARGSWTWTLLLVFSCVYVRTYLRTYVRLTY